MQRLHIRIVFLCGFLLCHAVGARADRVVLTNGKVIRGTVFDDGGARLTIQVSKTISMQVRRDEVARIIREHTTTPRRAGPDGERPDGPATGPVEQGRRKVVCFAQVHGSIESALLAAELRQSCARAKEYGASVIVFEIDTPGGRLDVTQEIVALIESLSPIQTVAYVGGGTEGGAYSAGVMLAVACNETFMAPGTAFGAASPVRVTKRGVSPVGEKTVSAVTAKVRSLAQKNNYPPAVVAAMVDADIEIRMARIQGRNTYLSIKAGAEKPPEHKATLGDYVVRRGKLLTLTAVEAKRLGVASDIVASRQELVSALGLPDPRVIALNTMAAFGEAVRRRDRYVRQLDAEMASYEATAVAIDPARYKYPRARTKKGFREIDDFLDDGRLWRRRSDACVRVVDQFLAACRKKLVLARKYPELKIPTAPIEARMTKMLAIRERVRGERGNRGSER